MEKGRTIEGPYGPVVHLDIRHLGEKVINTKLPFVRELCLKYQNIDPIKELIPVRPVVHYMMGGVHTDINGATPLEGLFAAGEVACVSINGANRLGSNSLTELLVFGARAGRAAAAFASEQKEPSSGTCWRRQWMKSGDLEEQFLGKTGGRERIATIREEMQKAVEEGAGIYRTQRFTCGSGRQAATAAGAVPQHVAIEDHSHTFNTELTAALELFVHAGCRRSNRPMRLAAHGISRGSPAHGLSQARR